MVRRYFFGKDYGQDERDYCPRPGGLLKVWMRPKVRQKGSSSGGRVSKIRNQPV